MEKSRPSLEEVFSPRAIAVVGASSSGRNLGIWPLIEAGFPVLYPVNPKYTEVFGLPCYPSLRDIPGVVDHVVVSIPAESVLALLDDCAAKGVRSVRFFTAGFSESGYAEGAELEAAMLDKAMAGGFRIIGPNCVGMLVPKNRLTNATDLPMEPGPIAFISQSGGHAQSLPFFSAPRGLRFSKVVSYGNALDVDESELLDYLSQDPDTEIIAAYIEGVKDGRRFLGALKEAAARKPVIIYKSGTTDAGKRATRGHTASLAGSEVIFDTLCRQMNVIQVDDIEELMDMMVALRFTNPLPEGAGVALLGQGGGPIVSASDEMERAGLQVPGLSPEVQAELKQFLPLPGSIFGNPVDARTLLSPEAILATMRVLGKVPDIHMFVYHMGFHPVSRWGNGRFSSDTFLPPFIDTLTQVQQTTGKPVLLALRPAPDLRGMEEFLATQEALVKAGFPVFYSLSQVAKAMARLVAWRRSSRD